MKRVTMGRCPHVVNMIGCSTFQEPIALVLEYVPHGDLLSYLKAKRRKVCMVAKIQPPKLQLSGFNGQLNLICGF